MTLTASLTAGIFTVMLYGQVAHGQETQSPSIDTSVLQQHLPSEEKLEMLESEITQNPRNLDLYFEYATLATELREYEKAANMYEHMLGVMPDLSRIRLELAMIYLRQKAFVKAQEEIDIVLSGDVPQQVRDNLAPVLEQLDRATRTHIFSGGITIGLHQDSNANSAPASGDVIVRLQGTELPFELQGSARARPDTQIFTIASLNHQYRPIPEVDASAIWSWESSANYYRNEYDDFDNLNIKFISVKTGPAVTLLEGTLRAELSAGYNHIILDNHSFQRQYVGEAALTYALDASTRLRLIAREELRDYINSPSQRTFDQRDGDAKEIRLGATHRITDRDILDADIRLRREDTNRAFFDNQFIDTALSYTHQFDAGWFSRANAGWRNTDFEAPDPSISVTTTRKEKEGRAGFMIGKSFENNVTATLGYEYRDIESNITNFSYDNHRISSTLGVRF